MKILCIDDSKTIHRIIQSALAVLNLEILEALSPKIALKILEENLESPPSLILLDWNMPEMNGLELLKKLKADPNYRDIAVVMLTSEGSQANIIEALKSGALNYITKPFSQEDLVTRVMQCLGTGV